MALIPKNPNEAAYTGGKKHFYDVIKNRGGADAIVFRAPEEDFNNNSTLIVMPDEKAVFIHNGKIEAYLGSGTHVLSTENYPFLTRMRTMLSGGISKYNCVIIFIRTTSTKEIVWGDSIAVADPRLGIMTEFGVNGAYRVSVADPERLIMSILGTKAPGMTGDLLQKYCSHQFLSIIKSQLARAILESGEDLRNVTASLKTYSDSLFPVLSEELDQFGLKLQSFAISGMELHQDDVRRHMEEVLGTKAEMGILGNDWDKVKRAEVMANYSRNQGPAGMIGGMALMPVVTQMMGRFASAMGQADPSPEASGDPGKLSRGKTCSKCRYPVFGSMKYCPNCGDKLNTGKTCPFCNAEIDDLACFCSACGKKVKD